MLSLILLTSINQETTSSTDPTVTTNDRSELEFNLINGAIFKCPNDCTSSFEQGQNSGETVGYTKGYEAGKDEGFAAGMVQGLAQSTPEKIVVVAVNTQEGSICKFGACEITFAVKSFGADSAVIKSAAIYRAKISSPDFPSIWTDPVSAQTENTVTVSLPNARFPMNTGNSTEGRVELYEGDTPIPFGSGFDGKVYEKKEFYIDILPHGPEIIIAETITIWKPSLEDKKARINFKVMDLDTHHKNLTITAVLESQLGSKSYDVEKIDEAHYSIELVILESEQWTRNLVITADDGVTDEVSKMSEVRFRTKHDMLDYMPKGTVVQHVSSYKQVLSEKRASYYGDIDNLEALGLSTCITAKRDNSKFFVRFQLDWASREYYNFNFHIFDIFRKAGIKVPVSVSREIESGTDGTVVYKPSDNMYRVYEKQLTMSIFDRPKVKAGEDLCYDVYYGEYDWGTINYGGGTRGSNSDPLEYISIVEITDEECPHGDACADVSLMPDGAVIQVQDSTAFRASSQYAPEIRYVSYEDRKNRYVWNKHEQCITTLVDNSKIAVQWQESVSLNSNYGTNCYQIHRCIAEPGKGKPNCGESFKDLTAELGDTSTTGVSAESDGGQGWTGYPKYHYGNIVDEPGVPAGSTICYRTLFGNTMGRTVYFGSSRYNNAGSRTMQFLSLWEHKNKEMHKDYEDEAVNQDYPLEVLPEGSTCQFVNDVWNDARGYYLNNYDNQPSNFKPTFIQQEITLEQDGADIVFETQFFSSFYRTSGNSHYWSSTGENMYGDIEFQKDGGQWQSLSQYYAAGSDGFWSIRGNYFRWSQYAPSKTVNIQGMLKTKDFDAKQGDIFRFRVSVAMWQNGMVYIGYRWHDQDRGYNSQILSFASTSELVVHP